MGWRRSSHRWRRSREVLDTVDGYVVVANINSPSEAVIGGASEAVASAVVALNHAGFDAKPLPVSHAFHTAIVAPVSGPLRSVLEKMDLQPPNVPTVSNVTGEFYPMGPGVEPEMIDLLARQVARPVQFVKAWRPCIVPAPESSSRWAQGVPCKGWSRCLPES